MAKFVFEMYGRTDVGKVRANNEDNFMIDPELGLAIVADGMGGHSSGEMASKLAVDSTHDFARKFLKNGKNLVVGKVNQQFSELANQLASSVRLANQLVYETAKSKPQHHGMGTTIDCLLVQKEKISIAHIGDSRVYLVRERKLYQLTQDHSLVQDQVRQGLLTKEEAARSPMKNILSRALGVDETVEVDIYEIEAYPGDIFISCTDGLDKMVKDSEIVKTVAEMKTPKMIAEHLVDLANAAGGVDNVTVVVTQIQKITVWG